MDTRIFFRNIVLLATMLLVISCHQEDAHPSQVIARVDGVEITAHQLNNESQYNLTNNINKKNNEIIEDLINRQLLVNQSIKVNINRRPEVVQAIENAKARIYANAYLEELLSKAPLDEKKIIEDIKSQHQDVFLSHKTYKVETIKISNALSLQLLDKIMFTLKTFDEIKQLLIDENLNHTITVTEIPAEDMQVDFYKKYDHKLQPNHFLFKANNSDVEILGIKEINDSPISEYKYKKLLSEKLHSEIHSITFNQEIRRLRSVSNIELAQRLSN